MKNIITLALLLFLTKTIACCGYGRHQLYPIGKLDSNLIFIKLELRSNCKDMHNRHKFDYDGQFKLIRYTPDSNYTIQEFEKFHFINDSPDSNSTVIQAIQPYYNKAFAEAKKLPNLINIKPIKYISAIENIKENYVYIPKDTIPDIVINGINYDGNYNVWAGICGVRDKVNEVKEYSIKNETIYIINLGCRGNKEYKKADKFNQKQFKKLDKALTLISYRWHGFSEDIIIIEKNEK